MQKLLVRAVLFDLYGTLIVPRPDATVVGRVSESLTESFKLFGIDLAGVDTTDLETAIWEVELLPKENGSTLFELRLASYVYHHFGKSIPALDFREAADLACGAREATLMVDPAGIRVVEKLSRSYTVGLVTNFDHPRHIRSVLASTKLGSLMQDVVISGEVGLWKPDPAILHLACGRLHVSESETLYVGDSIVDYQAASGAGLQFAWIHRTDRAHRAEEEKTRQHFAESDAMLMRLSETGDIRRVTNLGDLL